MNAASARLISITAAVSLALGACATGSPDATQNPPATAASATPKVPSPSPATPTPTPTPTILPITSDDITDALPTNPMLSKVQGSTFKESANWDDGSDEGPEWVADSPLSKKQKDQVNIGELRRVKPDKCEAAAAFYDYGWLTTWDTSDTFTAVGYANKKRSHGDQGTIFQWSTVAYTMSEGYPQAWARNFVATYDECMKFTAIAVNGDVEKVDLQIDSRKYKTGLAHSASAIIVESRLPPSDSPFLVVWEPIGNVLYSSVIVIFSTSGKQWARASALYNQLADSLASVQGVEREPVKLLGGTEVVPNPADYTPPPKPGSSLV